MTRHALDPISAALGVATMAIGGLVMTNAIDLVDGDGGWWFALSALVVGLAVIPWTGGRGAAPAGQDAGRTAA